LGTEAPVTIGEAEQTALTQLVLGKGYAIADVERSSESRS